MGVGDPIKTEHFYHGTDHPEFAQYLKGEHGKILQLETDAILDVWTDMPIYSKGFGDCLPVIALKEKKMQMIHRGFGWLSGRENDVFTDSVNKQLLIWKESAANITAMKADRTRHLDTTMVEIKKLFGDNYQFIDFKINSMFDVVVDPKKNLLLVQFMRNNEFRKYNI